MAASVIEHVLDRLKVLGVHHVFGVPGDFAFSVQDAILADPELEWIGCCNELNAGYAADGYARMRGFAVLSTTFGVGELSAVNAIAGAYAENVPVIHITGMPATAVQEAESLVHHTLGTGEFDLFRRMADNVVAASAVLTPHNVAAETDRLLSIAVHQRRPVYMGLPSDLANEPASTAGADRAGTPVSSDPGLTPIG